MGPDGISHKEASSAFKALLARVGEIFGVFDLSFFVAGAVCLAGMVFGGYVFQAEWLTHLDVGSWHLAHVVAAILASYVLGIVCFAAGRRFRRDRRFYARLPEHLHFFGLEDRYRSLLPPSPDARDATRRYSLLYTRLWAEARQSTDLAPSFNLLTRYWILAAMCDGLAAAFSVWTVLWGFWAAHAATADATIERPPTQVVVLLGIGLVLAVVLSSSEALRYSETQMYELIATLAHRHLPLCPQPDPAAAADPEAPVVVPALVVAPSTDPAAKT